ncbi:MAG: hypothetical protein QXL45_02540 [Candidatus Bathyarchaeia archaeon]
MYAVSYLTLAPLLRALGREDFISLKRIFSGVRPLKPIARLIARYERKVLGWLSA